MIKVLLFGRYALRFNTSFYPPFSHIWQLD